MQDVLHTKGNVTRLPPLLNNAQMWAHNKIEFSYNSVNPQNHNGAFVSIEWNSLHSGNTVIHSQCMQKDPSSSPSRSDTYLVFLKYIVKRMQKVVRPMPATARVYMTAVSHTSMPTVMALGYPSLGTPSAWREEIHMSKDTYM